MCKHIQNLSVKRHFIINHCKDCEKINIRHYSFMLSFSYREFRVFAKQCLKTSFEEEAIECSGQEQIILSTNVSDLKLCLIRKEFYDLQNALKEASGNLHVSYKLLDTTELKKNICLN